MEKEINKAVVEPHPEGLAATTQKNSPGVSGEGATGEGADQSPADAQVDSSAEGNGSGIASEEDVAKPKQRGTETLIRVGGGDAVTDKAGIGAATDAGATEPDPSRKEKGGKGAADVNWCFEQECPSLDMRLLFVGMFKPSLLYALLAMFLGSLALAAGSAKDKATSVHEAPAKAEKDSIAVTKEKQSLTTEVCTPAQSKVEVYAYGGDAQVMTAGGESRPAPVKKQLPPAPKHDNCSQQEGGVKP